MLQILPAQRKGVAKISLKLLCVISISLFLSDIFKKRAPKKELLKINY
jgi:hypothetical protein